MKQLRDSESGTRRLRDSDVGVAGADDADDDAAGTPTVPYDPRTGWAAERTLLAIERTYAGWMRTGMGAQAVAAGLIAALPRPPANWLGKSTASVFLFAAALIFIAGHRHSRRLLRQLPKDVPLPQRSHFTRITVLFLVATVMIAAMIWLT